MRRGPTSESLDVALRQLRLMESYLQRFMALGRDAADGRRDCLLAGSGGRRLVAGAAGLRPCGHRTGIRRPAAAAAGPRRSRGPAATHREPGAQRRGGRRPARAPPAANCVALETVGAKTACRCMSRIRVPARRRRWPSDCSSRLSAESPKAPAWDCTWPGRSPRPITARSAGNAQDGETCFTVELPLTPRSNH